MARARELAQAAPALAAASISALFAEGILDLTWFSAAAPGINMMWILRAAWPAGPAMRAPRSGKIRNWISFGVLTSATLLFLSTRPSDLAYGAVACGGCVLVASAHIRKALAPPR